MRPIRVSAWTLSLILSTIPGILGFNITISQAQNNPVVTPHPSQWIITQDLCSGASPCSVTARISENNVLYIITSEELLAFHPGMSEPTVYHVPPGSLLYGSSVDFEPFGDDFVLFFALTHPGYYGFFQFDLDTEQVTALNLGNDFVACTPNAFQSLDRSFQRLGTSQNIIACSRNSFYVIDISTQSILDTVIFPSGDRHPLSRPWGNVIGGQNNVIYLRSSNFPNNELVAHLFPTLDFSEYPQNTTFVLSHTPLTPDWNIVPIPLEQITRTQLDTREIFPSRLVKVDETGNLYFYKRWYGADNLDHIDISKFSPEGEQIWQITEENLGSVPVLVALPSDDNLLLLDIFGDGALKELDVAEVFPTPTPITPTETPSTPSNGLRGDFCARQRAQIGTSAAPSLGLVPTPAVPPP